MKQGAVLLFAAFFLLAADLSPQQRYIERYSAIAVSEMERTGVPASITLAQGILESSSGQSSLAMEANNHFGIKCHNDWKGKRFHMDDDSRNECFRVYARPEDSYRDHSDFLRYRDRYRPLFELDSKDYEAWANGLSSCGYATDPRYPSKLISIIREYELYRFDNAQTVLPKTFKDLEQSSEYVLPTSDVQTFSLSRRIYERNGVALVYANEGESFESIARANNLFLKEILSFNDLKSVRSLEPGEAVFIGRKKARASRGLDKYVVGSDAETLRDISQRFAVRLSAIIKINGLSLDYTPSEGDTILLR